MVDEPDGHAGIIPAAPGGTCWAVAGALSPHARETTFLDRHTWPWAHRGRATSARSAAAFLRQRLTTWRGLARPAHGSRAARWDGPSAAVSRRVARRVPGASADRPACRW